MLVNLFLSFGENGDVIGTVRPKINYVDHKTGEVKSGEIEITFSWAKEEYQRAGGNSPVGAFLKKNIGVSVVRANREIDFGKFDFFSELVKPQHRWWGCEIKFNPEMDEVFWSRQ